MFDFYDRQWNATERELNKIKRAMQVLAYLALLGKKDSFKYKVLERYIEFCENDIALIWY